jgi:hypothetical protein
MDYRFRASRSRTVLEKFHWDWDRDKKMDYRFRASRSRTVLDHRTEKQELASN